MARADFRFSYVKRVRFSEIDAQAIVFNARYLDYLEIGSTEYFREVGALGGDFRVGRIAVDYKAPIRLDEQIDLCVRMARVGRTSMTLLFEYHGKDADDLRALGEMVYVHVDLADGRPAPVPDALIAPFEAFEGRSLRG